MTKTTTTQLPDLSQFIGSQEFYKHLFGKLLFTEGIQHLAEECGAYWLIDVVASYQGEPVAGCDGFQLWRIERDPNNDSGCIVTCRRDSGDPDSVKQVIEYTDFPLDEPFEWYVVGNVQGVTMMLKSEY